MRCVCCGEKGLCRFRRNLYIDDLLYNQLYGDNQPGDTFESAPSDVVGLELVRGRLIKRETFTADYNGRQYKVNFFDYGLFLKKVKFLKQDGTEYVPEKAVDNSLKIKSSDRLVSSAVINNTEVVSPSASVKEAASALDIKAQNNAILNGTMTVKQAVDICISRLNCCLQGDSAYLGLIEGYRSHDVCPPVMLWMLHSFYVRITGVKHRLYLHLGTENTLIFETHSASEFISNIYMARHVNAKCDVDIQKQLNVLLTIDKTILDIYCDNMSIEEKIDIKNKYRSH